MRSDITVLEEFKNFTLVRYAGQYLLTIDGSIDRPIIFQDNQLDKLLMEVKAFYQRVKSH